jgi:porin
MRSIWWCSLLLLTSATALAESPYEIATALTLESVSILDGGVQTGSRQLANLDVTLSLNTESAGWWSGGEWFAYVLGDYGHNPSDKTGDLQGITNIATDNNLLLYEFWYRQSFANDAVQLLVGLHDYNSTFYSLDTAGLFTHPSFGIGPDTSQVGPSIFARTAMAVHLNIQLDNQYLQLAVYDGVPGDPAHARGTHIKFGDDDGLFSAVEWGLKEEGAYKLAVGGWQHTALVENPVTATPSDDNSGIYLIAEKNLNDTLAVFLQLGQADKQLNQIEHYVGTGVVLNSFWRDGDGLGLAVAHARNGEPYLVQNPEQLKAETAWELSYFSPVFEYLSVQASLYYIQQPSMDPTLEDALAFGTRAYIEF